MIRRTLSIRSRGTSPACSRHRGFSLVEVMMSVVLIAIGLALALAVVSGYGGKAPGHQRRRATGLVHQYGTGYCSTTNRKVTLSYTRTADDEWCIGMAEDDYDLQLQDRSGSGCQIGAQNFVIDNSHAGDKAMMHSLASEGDAYYIDPVRGLFLPCDVQTEMR